MNHLIRTGLALLLIAGVATAGTMPFDPLQGLVEVEVVLDGRVKGRFGIDTGADQFYIDRTFAEKNGIPVSSGPPQRAVVGAEGHSEARAINIRSLEIGDERLYNLTATAIDMQNLVADKRATPPDGLIGYEVLRRFYITVDYPNKSMTLQMHEPSFLESAPPSVPFEIAHHLILVDVTIDDSVTVPMALDYCASWVFISPTLAERLGHDPAAEQVQLGTVSLGETITSSDVAAGISDLSPLHARLRGVEFEGLIGGTFLYRHKITIDYRRNRIYLHD